MSPVSRALTPLAEWKGYLDTLQIEPQTSSGAARSAGLEWYLDTLEIETYLPRGVRPRDGRVARVSRHLDGRDDGALVEVSKGHLAALKSVTKRDCREFPGLKTKTETKGGTMATKPREPKRFTRQQVYNIMKAKLNPRFPFGDAWGKRLIYRTVPEVLELPVPNEAKLWFICRLNVIPPRTSFLLMVRAITECCERIGSKRLWNVAPERWRLLDLEIAKDYAIREWAEMLRASGLVWERACRMEREEREVDDEDLKALDTMFKHQAIAETALAIGMFIVNNATGELPFTSHRVLARCANAMEAVRSQHDRAIAAGVYANIRKCVEQFISWVPVYAHSNQWADEIILWARELAEEAPQHEEYEFEERNRRNRYEKRRRKHPKH